MADEAWSARQQASGSPVGPTTSFLIAEVELAEEPEWGIHHDAVGRHAFGKVEYEIRDGEVVYMDGGRRGSW